MAVARASFGLGGLRQRCDVVLGLKGERAFMVAVGFEDLRARCSRLLPRSAWGVGLGQAEAQGRGFAMPLEPGAERIGGLGVASAAFQASSPMAR